MWPHGQLILKTSVWFRCWNTIFLTLGQFRFCTLQEITCLRGKHFLVRPWEMPSRVSSHPNSAHGVKCVQILMLKVGSLALMKGYKDQALACLHAQAQQGRQHPCRTATRSWRRCRIPPEDDAHPFTEGETGDVWFIKHGARPRAFFIFSSSCEEKPLGGMQRSIGRCTQALGRGRQHGQG